MQTSRTTSTPAEHHRLDAAVEVLLETAAVVLWLLVTVGAIWLERHPAAPTGLVVANFVVGLVVLPLAVGGALAWRRSGRAHQGGAGALAGLLALWGQLALLDLVSLATEFERYADYLRTEWVEVVAVFGIFGVAGAVMGAGGGTAAVRVRRAVGLSGGGAPQTP